MSVTGSVLHLMRREDYEVRAGQTTVVDCPPGGFIHCTGTADVLRQVANSVFGATPGEFVVLVIDPSRLRAEVRWEPPEPAPPAGSPLSQVFFPHVYGDINRGAVMDVRPARRAARGEFLET